MDTWVRVGEQMPDDGIEVLLGWVDDDEFEIGWYDGEVWRTPFDELIMPPPTHWMDLPAGPT